MGSKLIIVDDWPQLFIDDMLMEHWSNVSLRINPPMKAGPVLRADRLWESHRVGAYGTVMEDQGIYKMWYDAIDWDGRIFHCYAISRDGISWEKPNLGLVEYHGSKDNNILPLPPCGTVFIDPKAPREKRYKYITYGHGSEAGYLNEHGVRIWWSEDGLRWLRNKDYALPLISDTQTQAFWDDKINKYVAYLRAWNPLRCVARVEVEDILKPFPYEPRRDVQYGPVSARENCITTELPITFKYDDEDPKDSDHYNPCVIKYRYAKDVYFMFPSAYLHYPEPPVGKRHNDGPLEIQIATSRDGIHWNRLDREPYVRLGRTGEPDSGMMYMLIGMIHKADEIWMYYAGYDYTHGCYDLSSMKYTGAIFRVVQRLDGFVSIDAGYKGGEFTTKPLLFKGRRLLLNVDTSATGGVRVEIQDEDGRPLNKFNLDDCDEIHANDCHKVVTWNGVSDVSSLAGTPIRLRFSMKKAKLYSFRFSERL